MVSNHKEKQSKRKLLSQLDDFDQDTIIGSTVSDKQENTTKKETTGDEELTVGNPGSNLTAHEKVVNVKI